MRLFSEWGRERKGGRRTVSDSWVPNSLASACHTTPVTAHCPACDCEVSADKSTGSMQCPTCWAKVPLDSAKRKATAPPKAPPPVPIARKALRARHSHGRSGVTEKPKGGAVICVVARVRPIPGGDATEFTASEVAGFDHAGLVIGCGGRWFVFQISWKPEDDPKGTAASSVHQPGRGDLAPVRSARRPVEAE